MTPGELMLLELILYERVIKLQLGMKLLAHKNEFG
jgi:hypothetical protein